MDGNLISVSFDAVQKIGLLAVMSVLGMIIGGLFIVPGMRSAARSRENRMKHEDEDERTKTRMLKEERERFDKERHDQWSVVIRLLEVILSEVRLLTLVVNRKETS